MNAAYLETPSVTHIVTWAQKERFTHASGKAGYSTEIVTLCGRKKHFLKHPKLMYPGQEAYDMQPTKPTCKICVEIIDEATHLAAIRVG